MDQIKLPRKPSHWRHDIHHNYTQHNDIEHYDTQHKGLICDTQHTWHLALLCHYAECCYAECRILFFIMMNVIKLSVIMVSGVAPWRRVELEPTSLRWRGKRSTTVLIVRSINCQLPPGVDSAMLRGTEPH